MLILAILNTAMTLGILLGVWVGVLKSDSEMKDALFGINRFLKEKIEERK